MISFVYFDVGGVVIKDFSNSNKWKEMIEGMGIDDSKTDAALKIWQRYRQQICISCDVDTLPPILNRELGLNLPPSYSMLQDFVDRFEPNPSIWPIIEKIKKVVQIGLLTNMYPRMLISIRQKDLLPTVEIDAIVDSSLVGHQKPELEIYAMAQEKAGVSPPEILFIDNQEKNLVPAQKLGWQTFWYDSANYEQSSLELNKFIDAQLKGQL